VFAASSGAVAPHFFAAADALGREMAARGLTLVYGGGQVGLMGAVARGIHAASGRVVAVIPHYLKTRELLYAAADEIVVTDGLRERKAEMEARADAFVALPGGFGTLEETLEVITLKQLRRHTKPVVLLNTAGFFGPLLATFTALFDGGFARPDTAALYHVAGDPASALTYLETYRPTLPAGKWL
jgi:uncharacterized protein (TIGR00730 family)